MEVNILQTQDDFATLRSSHDLLMNSLEMIAKNFEELLKEVGEVSLIW